MNKLLLALLAVSLTACGPADPNARATHQARLQAQADRTDYQIVTLFTKDGCTLYRFYDMGHYRYFTSCNGSTATEHTAGKSTFNEEIPTAVN